MTESCRYRLLITLVRCAVVLAGVLLQSTLVSAQWSGEIQNNLFYTDDVGLFSATRRLSLQNDPTQPVVDRTGQGSDMVYEPSVDVRRAFDSRWGRTELSAQAQGFVYAGNPVYNHGSYRLRLTQDVASETAVRLYYFYGPNLFLGKNDERRSGKELLVDERVTTHFWSGHLERRVAANVTVRLLGRYGTRQYNEAFSERDTRFWTVGPHVEWMITPRVQLLVGYHYERGLADGRRQSQVHDDISYVNHYASAELVVQAMERVSVIFGLDYERNNFTSGLADDMHRGAHENVYQGDLEFQYRFTDAMTLKFGCQHGSRKFSFEPTSVSNTNLWLGGDFKF